MANGINKNVSDESLSAIISHQSFISLNTDLQSKIIDNVKNSRAENRGHMGKIFGNNKENAAMYIAFLLCVILMLIFIIDMIHAYFAGQSINMDLFGSIMPIITLSLGYIFGKGINNN